MKLGTFVTKADKIIELPKFKTHGYMFITGACKIPFGHVPGMTKGKLHAQYPKRADFADMMLDVDPPDILIEPPLGEVGFMDFHRAKEGIEAGYIATAAALEENADVLKSGIDRVIDRLRKRR